MITDTNQEIVLESVLNLAKTCEYEMGHTHQVTRLALRMFDELEELHHLGPQERFWLQCGALLHDIGWIEGWKGHHKVSLRIIMDTPLLPFDNKERMIVGSIARYHRKALPDPSHDHFAALEVDEREKVRILSALLRIADGLDRTHQNRVRDLSARIKPHKVILHCAVATPAPEEMAAAKDKSDLFEQVFKKKIEVVWKAVS